MKKTDFGNKWFIDKEGEYKYTCHLLKSRVVSTKTRFQKMELYDTCGLGRIVVLDNKIQSAEVDEFIYHEALVHPAMISHPDPENILILGGGEGAVLREVLKHPTVKKIIMVDVDEEFVNLCKTYLKNWHRNSFEDKRVKVIFNDAMKYVKKTELKFDVIIADISDPVKGGPASKLYKKEFYSLIKKILMPDGIFVTHATEVYYTPNKSISARVFKTLASIFPKAQFYFEYIPSFSSVWAFTICSSEHSARDMSSAVIVNRLKKRELKDLYYYDLETHRRLFCIPKFIKKFIE